MAGKIIIFTGIILIVVGVIVTQSDSKVTINKKQASEEDSRTAKLAVGGGLCGLGLLFAIGGTISIVRNRKQQKRNMYILQNGLAAEGTVTFVDKNWAIKVNNNPVYSIVEYTYSDKFGQQHTRRINNLNSEIVIRKQILVGSKIPVKYASENPAESVIVLSA